MVWHPDMDMRCGLRTARLEYKALLYCMRRSDVRHDEDENFGDNYFIIFNRDLVRDQDEVYIYATLMEYKMSPAIYPTNSNRVKADFGLLQSSIKLY